ncbi:DiGeorge syndrome critical region 6 (DGCR6) protein [Phytophthora infestans]|uniref:DiGeorge syndrome critical region 6 (DGCR6) protein n=1 Tax=Phytophthora infestans TaxID=4787 RepID=A0A833SPU0_PHYIN|nr:DiGeorge syndrome critical region 6 (DGCR6) protein [Phytophthora infestans]
MADDIATWDASGVVARAKALIHSSNYDKVADARKDVDDTVAKWVAFVQTQSDPMNVARGSTAVVALWRQYAALEMELRQFKQATKVFERAVSCPIAGSCTALWLQYADFCVQRKKFSNARKIFVRALQTLPEREQTAVWARFYGFVCTHVDNKLSLAMLQHQVMPDKFPQPGTASTAAPSATSAASVATGTLPSTLQPQQQPKTGAVSLVDPVVAFIDKTGEVTPSPSPLAVESVGHLGAVKRPADPRLAGGAKRAKQDVAAATTPAEPTAFFSHIPVTLPSIPSCPHLLFDSVADGGAQKQIGNELLERLSDVLGDSAVFEGVRDLRDNQRTRDREMLYRWQELVAMQMKEGSELFARHVALEMQHGFSDPRGLIALKTQHLEQRREFSSRCQMSQQQFIDICAMDRAGALKAQQISLENMKIPEIQVTTEAEAISLQRAIVGLILEAEKLWREENQRSIDAAKKSQTASSSASSSRPPARQRRDSQDSTTSSHSTARSSISGGGFRGSGSGNRQDPRGARNWGGNGNNRRRDRDPRGGRGRSNKWDIQPPQSGPVAAAAPSQQSRYDYPGQQTAPAQQMPLYDRGPQQMQAPSQQPRPFQQQPYGMPNASHYDEYGGRQGPMPDQQAYAPQPSGAYFAGPQDGPHGDRFVGQGGPSRGAAGGWPQQQQQVFHQPQQPIRPHSGPPAGGNPSLARYGAGAGPPDGSGPASYGNSRMPTDAPYYQEPPPQQGPYGQQQQPPQQHRGNFSAYPYDQYGPPQGEFQQRGGGRPMGNYGQQQQPPPQQRFQQNHVLPSPGMNSNRRNRRGGRRR